MVARINTGLRNYTLNEFLESLSEASPTYVYAAIGKTTAWADEAAPDTPQETIEEEFSYYSTSAAWKRIQSADFKKAIRRVNWTSGITYAAYSSSDNMLFSKDFYVLAENSGDYNVYKCLSNNNNIPSTVKPTGTGTSNITTGDGYIWKFLYAISPADVVKFMTTNGNWMPIGTNSTVQAAAANGAVELIKVTNGGTGYTVATVAITGTGGTGATATATIVSGIVTGITVSAKGSGYKTIVVTITGDGVGATATANITPYGGHGILPEEELGCRNVIVYVELNGAEGGDFPTNIDYRRIFITKNPLKVSDNAVATANTYTGSAIKIGSGEVLYVENRGAITRASDQTETFRFIIYF